MTTTTHATHMRATGPQALVWLALLVALVVASWSIPERLCLVVTLGGRTRRGRGDR